MLVSALKVLVGALALAPIGFCAHLWDKDLLKQIYTVAGHVQSLGVDRDFRLRLETEKEELVRSYSSAIELPEKYIESKLPDVELLEFCAGAWFEAVVVDDHENKKKKLRRPPAVMACILHKNFIFFGSSVKGAFGRVNIAQRVEQGRNEVGTINNVLRDLFSVPQPDEMDEDSHKNRERCGEVNALRVREDIFGLKPIKPNTMTAVAFGLNSDFHVDFTKLNRVWDKLPSMSHEEKGEKWSIGPKLPCGDQDRLGGHDGCNALVTRLGMKVVHPSVGKDLTMTKLSENNKDGIPYKIIKTNRRGKMRPDLSGNPTMLVHTEPDTYNLPCGLESVTKAFGADHKKAGQARSLPDQLDNLNATSTPEHEATSNSSNQSGESTSFVARSGSLAWRAEMHRRDITARAGRGQCLQVKMGDSKDTELCSRALSGKKCHTKPKTKGTHSKAPKAKARTGKGHSADTSHGKSTGGSSKNKNGHRAAKARGKSSSHKAQVRKGHSSH